MKKLLKKTLKLILPIVLGGFILFWVYHNFDFTKVGEVLLHGTNWWWMFFSLLFGVLAQVFRGWRWKQMLEPLEAFPKRSDCVNAIFISYAASLIVPRVGEVSRCGVLAKYDNVSFAKSLGTVVTERLVDTLTILLITGVTVLLQLPIFVTFLQQTGTKIPSLLHLLTSVWFYIVLFCFIGVGMLLYYLRKTLFFYERVKGFVLNIWEGVILQAHMDMVPQKNNDTVHDFEKDPIETYIDGDWVKAKGTTLGADNGLGVAAIMAVLEAKDLKHGPLEALITKDEETGMYGAFGLKPGTVNGEILLNLDSEDEGELYIGCAGGMDVTATLEYKEVAPEEGDIAVKVTLKGLRGGHSGLEINEGRANANKVLVRFIREAVASYEARLASWEGGNMRNAIPREAHAVVTIPAENEEELLGLVKYCEDLFNEEYSTIETPISFTAERVEVPAGQVPEEIQDNLIDAIFACQNGVTRMIPTVPDTVETSSNLAIITIAGGKAEIKILARSSSDSMKEYLTTSLESCFSMAGMKVEMTGGYSGWQPDVNSPILHAMKASYKQQFGVEPAVKVIHAGLECGIIGAIIPGLDMISFGPTLRSPHSPDERALIPTVQKFYDFLVATLEQTPMK